MKAKIAAISILLFAMVAALPMVSVSAMHEPSCEPKKMSPMVSGGGWFLRGDDRNNFAFAVLDGKLNETDCWFYDPKGVLIYHGRDFRETNESANSGKMHKNEMIRVIGYRIWRLKIDNVTGGWSATFGGWAAVSTGHGWTKNWWFSVQAFDFDMHHMDADCDRGAWLGRWMRSTHEKDEFHIRLWKPGEWNLTDNQLTLGTVFYESGGKLGGGNIEIRL